MSAIKFGKEARELKLLPGSNEAVQSGCICELSKDSDNYLINEHCPIHWHILLVSRTSKIHKYILLRDSQNTILITGLIIAVLVTFGYFLFMVK